jgi:hypothetical protein
MVAQLVNKYLAFMKPKGSLSSSQEPGSRTNLIHTLICYFFKTILILSSHLHLSLPSGLFPSKFLTKNVYNSFQNFSNYNGRVGVYLMYGLWSKKVQSLYCNFIILRVCCTLILSAA